jgi:hypothetical protein
LGVVGLKGVQGFFEAGEVGFGGGMGLGEFGDIAD